MSRTPNSVVPFPLNGQNLSKTELLQVLDRTSDELDTRRRVRLLAKGLMTAIGIEANENDLVVWLGNDASRNNLDAICHWVVQELAILKLDVKTADPRVLRKRLMEKLAHLGEDE